MSRQQPFFSDDRNFEFQRALYAHTNKHGNKDRKMGVVVVKTV